MSTEKGYIHIYTGEGKGKTTAAFGLALRAAGHGWRVFIGQFMKGRTYGEVQALRNHSLITVEQFSDDHCLIRKSEVTPERIARARKGLNRCRTILSSGGYRMLIMDEAVVAIWFGLLSEGEVLEMLEGRPAEVEIVLTGRYASAALLEQADIATEMRCLRHYYSQGVTAREGIER